MATPLPFVYHLDEPTADQFVHCVRVRGWIQYGSDAQVEMPYVAHGGRVTLERVPRPDVEQEFGSKDVIGFDGLVPLADDETCALVVTVNGVSHQVPIPLAHTILHTRQFLEHKAAKLARIEPLLRCPRLRRRGSRCMGRLSRRGERLRCKRCRRRYDASDTCYDFLDASLESIAAIDLDHMSSGPYDDVALSLMDELEDGLILDDGAGFRRHYVPNVVNYELVEYTTTDVRGTSERLPFADDSFDALFSIVMLEHVQDPFTCATEMTRVVKPGGKLYVTVPFLQPYHGFPHHYYNMTQQGLERLFADDCTIDHLGVPEYGQPIATLTWFLRSWLAGLPDPTAEKLADLRVRDLIDADTSYLREDFVTELSDDAVTELASVNAILATKR